MSFFLKQVREIVLKIDRKLIKRAGAMAHWHPTRVHANKMMRIATQLVLTSEADRNCHYS